MIKYYLLWGHIWIYVKEMEESKILKVKKLQKIDINKAIKEENSKVKNNGYIIKEAEMILNQCFSKVEEKDTKNVKQEYDKKNKKLKRYLIITSAIVFLETIILLIK